MRQRSALTEIHQPAEQKAGTKEVRTFWDASCLAGFSSRTYRWMMSKLRERPTTSTMKRPYITCMYTRCNRTSFSSDYLTDITDSPDYLDSRESTGLLSM